MNTSTLVTAGALITSLLVPASFSWASDDRPTGTKTLDGIRIRGKDVSKGTRKQNMMGDRDAKGRRKPLRTGPSRCGIGVYDGVGCVEPRSKVEIYPRNDRGRPRPVRPDRRLITSIVVRHAVRDVAFPKLGVRIQPPGGKTLVNLKTIVYTEPVPFETVIPILTWPVTVRATPESYTWDFGDGSIRTTDGPGARYPSFEVFHQYQQRGSVHLRVTVHYAARYRTPGGGWRSIGTVPITGPATGLLVCESRPVLVDPDNANPQRPTLDPTNPCHRR